MQRDFFKKLFFNMGITPAVTLGLFAIILLSIVGSNYVVFIKKKDVFESKLLKKQALYLDIIKPLAKKSLQREEHFVLEEVLDIFFNDENIVEITLKDTQENILYHKHLPQRAIQDIYLKTDELFDGNKKLGDVSLKISNHAQQGKLKSYIAEGTMIFLMQFITSLVLIYILIRFKIANPMKKLAILIDDIKNKKFSTDYTWDYADELNSLGKQLNEVKKDFSNLILKDTLTNTYNRRFLEEKITQLIHDKISFSIICFDIDNFKEINDSYGYEKGDEILKALVAFVNKAYIKKSLLGRWNSQEFMILLENTKIEEAYAIAKNLQESIYAKAILPTVHITCSFGVSCYEESEESLSLLKRVDKALFMAKVEGKNRVVTL